MAELKRRGGREDGYLFPTQAELLETVDYLLERGELEVEPHMAELQRNIALNKKVDALRKAREKHGPSGIDEKAAYKMSLTELKQRASGIEPGADPWAGYSYVE